MTPEHPTPSEHEAFHHEPGPEAQEAVRGVLARLSSPEQELIVIEGFLAHGAGFAAFLCLADTAAEDPQLIHRYEQVYADAWDSLDDLVTDTIEALGWREALTALTEREGIPPDYLTWNYRAIYDRLHDMYSFVQLDGWIHAFHR